MLWCLRGVRRGRARLKKGKGCCTLLSAKAAGIRHTDEGLPGASFVFLRRLPLVVIAVELDEYPMRADARGRVELQEVVMQVPAWIANNQHHCT
jgi:hypothetical protein